MRGNSINSLGSLGPYVVGSDLGCGYSTIQSAIDDAPVGATIYVKSGTYTENIGIDGTKNIVAFSNENTTLVGHIELIAGDLSIANLNFDITALNYGIYLQVGSTLHISGCKITNHDTSPIIACLADNYNISIIDSSITGNSEVFVGKQQASNVYITLERSSIALSSNIIDFAGDYQLSATNCNISMPGGISQPQAATSNLIFSFNHCNLSGYVAVAGSSNTYSYNYCTIDNTSSLGVFVGTLSVPPPGVDETHTFNYCTFTQGCAVIPPTTSYRNVYIYFIECEMLDANNSNTKVIVNSTRTSEGTFYYTDAIRVRAQVCYTEATPGNTATVYKVNYIDGKSTYIKVKATGHTSDFAQVCGGEVDNNYALPLGSFSPPIATTANTTIRCTSPFTSTVELTPDGSVPAFIDVNITSDFTGGDVVMGWLLDIEWIMMGASY